MKKMLKIQEIQCNNAVVLNATQAKHLLGGGPFMTPNCPPPVGGLGASNSGADIKTP